MTGRSVIERRPPQAGEYVTPFLPRGRKNSLKICKFQFLNLHPPEYQEVDTVVCLLLKMLVHVKKKQGTTTHRNYKLPQTQKMAEERKKDETKRKKNKEEEAPTAASSDPQATVASGGGHSGAWSYHDDDCWCMIAGGYCNRDGHVWSCCGAVAEESTCAGPGRKHHTAVSNRSGDKACHCQECVNTQDQP